MFNLGYSCLIGCGRITIKVKGLEKMPEDTHFLLVSNHRSKFDISLIFLSLRILKSLLEIDI